MSQANQGQQVEGNDIDNMNHQMMDQQLLKEHNYLIG
jgi:hypothetical protein